MILCQQLSRQIHQVIYCLYDPSRTYGLINHLWNNYFNYIFSKIQNSRSILYTSLHIFAWALLSVYYPIPGVSIRQQNLFRTKLMMNPMLKENLLVRKQIPESKPIPALYTEHPDLEMIIPTIWMSMETMINLMSILKILPMIYLHHHLQHLLNKQSHLIIGKWYDYSVGILVLQISDMLLEVFFIAKKPDRIFFLYIPYSNGNY